MKNLLNNRNTKHINKLFFSTLLVVAMFLPNMATGQDAIYELPWVSAKKSIIREYRENIAIVYSFDGNDGCFTFTDMSTMSCRYAIIPGLNVNDFEIFEESVYFCGSTPMGNVVGFFEITPTFFMGATAQFAYMPTSMPCPVLGSSGIENIVRLDRLEVMGTSGLPHMIITGESTCTYPTQQLNHCIVDVYFDGAYWRIAITQEHESIFYYDDVAITPLNVVVVGHKHQSNGEYIFSLPRPSSPIDNIFNMPSLLFNIYAYGGGAPYLAAKDEDIIIEHISNEVFATVCHGGYVSGSTTITGTVLNVYNTVSNVLIRCLVPDTSTEYKDLRFNSGTNSLYLLPGAVNSSLPDGYLEYVLDPSFVKLNRVYKHYNTPGIFLGSMDASPKTYGIGRGQSMVSSMGTTRLQLWRHLPVTGCSIMEEIIPTSLMIYGGPFQKPFYYGTHAIVFNSYNPTVVQTHMSRICGTKDSE